MTTIIFDKENNKKLNRRFKGGYKHPVSDAAWEEEKASKNLSELVEVHDESPEYDPSTHKVARSEYPDFSVENEFDGEYHYGYQIVELTPDERTRYQERQSRKSEEDLIRQELKSTSPIRDDLANPQRVAELEKRVQKLEKLIL